MSRMNHKELEKFLNQVEDFQTTDNEKCAFNYLVGEYDRTILPTAEALEFLYKLCVGVLKDAAEREAPAESTMPAPAYFAWTSQHGQALKREGVVHAYTAEQAAKLTLRKKYLGDWDVIVTILTPIGVFQEFHCRRGAAGEWELHRVRIPTMKPDPPEPPKGY